jgi:hypothetical protein
MLLTVRGIASIMFAEQVELAVPETPGMIVDYVEVNVRRLISQGQPTDYLSAQHKPKRVG